MRYSYLVFSYFPSHLEPGWDESKSREGSECVWMFQENIVLEVEGCQLKMVVACRWNDPVFSSWLLFQDVHTKLIVL